MKNTCRFLLSRLRNDQSGQVLVMSAVLMTGFLGMAAMVADVGDVYYSYSELQASTNAAALAGGAYVGISSTQAQTIAAEYGSFTGENNWHSNLNVTAAPTVTLTCVSTTVAGSPPCLNTGYGSNVNAIQVTQTATVKTYFAALFGHPYVTLTATASALMGTPNSTPRNIAIILDTTESMTASDSSCSGAKSQEACAQNGVQQLLTGLAPCISGGCGTLTNGLYKNTADSVALFTFPELSNSTQQQYDTDCSSSQNPGITPYTFPSSTGTSYTQSTTTGDYEVTPFLSNYQTAASMGTSSVALAGTGSNASAVVEAVGGGGCAAGMADPGGEGTYYAGVLYAAQGALLAQQAALAAQSPSITSQNIIIIISDGAATAKQSQMASTANGTGLYTSTSGSYVNECQQAITASNNIKAQGTIIYSVSYGAQTTGCTTDNASGQSSPCATMQLMAGNKANPSLGTNSPYFYSGNQGGSNSCPSTYNANVSSLNGIFGAITTSFGPARLIPNASYPSS